CLTELNRTQPRPVESFLLPHLADPQLTTLQPRTPRPAPLFWSVRRHLPHRSSARRRLVARSPQPIALSRKCPPCSLARSLRLAPGQPAAHAPDRGNPSG